ncbi:MAG: alanine racemase [Alphaproteobacteria bacterium]
MTAQRSGSAPASLGPVPDPALAGPGAWLTIDLDAVAANYRLMKDAARGARTAGVVKADGYGLGAVPVARRLAREGCDLFFVAHLSEALTLRRDGGALLEGCAIAVLNGVPPGCEGLAIGQKIIPVLNAPEAVIAWAEAAAGPAGPHAPAFVQIETGMNRLGLTGEDVAAVRGRIESLSLAGILSHFACADDPDHPLNAVQTDRFRSMAGTLPSAPWSLANSAATLSRPDALFDLVRPGIGLYGANPFAERPNPLRPTVELTARILQTRRIDKGDAVGYGATYVAEGPRRLATLAIGYADGYVRAGSGRNAAYVRTPQGPVAAPVLGRISMDLVTVDVTDAPEGLSRVGDSVIVIGGPADVDTVGRAAGTLGYEILTSLGHRYARTYLGAV